VTPVATTVKKCFCRILTTFPGLATIGTGKVENRACMTWFCTRMLPTLFGTQFLSLPIGMTEKCFGPILTTFSSPGTTGATKVENGVQMTTFGTRNILTQFVVQLLSFPVSTVKRCFGWILMTFPGPRYHQSRQSWKPDPFDLVLHWKLTHTIWDAVPIISHQYDWKMFRSNFDNFSEPRYHRCRQSWKPGLYDLVLHLNLTHTIWDAILILSHQYDRKMFRSNFDDFFGPGYIGADKFEIGPRWLGLAAETYSHFLRWNSYCFLSERLKNFSVEFWQRFWARAPLA